VTTEDENDMPLPGEMPSGEIVSGEITPGELDGGQRDDARRYGQGPGRPPSKKQRILAWLADRNWDCVTEEYAGELARTFPDCSDDTRRAALLESGIHLASLVEGVVQDTYKHLEATLGALLAEYLAARESGDAPRRQLIRSIVIRAKEHTELAARNPKTHDLKRAVKLEMALWLRTWLENPPLFPDWLELRKRQIFSTPAQPKENSPEQHSPQEQPDDAE
jgi:hypothetical protein